MVPKHGETRGEERYDRPSFAWIPADEWLRRHWEREDRIFAKRANQGELKTPMLISDSLGLRGVQSQVDGREYDSKSNLRKHYRQSGVIEVGNDVCKTRFLNGTNKPTPDPARSKANERAIFKAFNRMEMPPV